MLWVSLVLSAGALAVGIIILVLLLRNASLRRDAGRDFAELRMELGGNIHRFGESVRGAQQNAESRQAQRLSELQGLTEQKLEAIRQTLERRISAMQADNNQHLQRMQETVDEKLQKTLETRMTQSFALVSEQLQRVYEGLGEMQKVATGVTDLKKVLSNVKTRGILGEIQLGAILAEILSPEQYAKNVAVLPGSSAVVEYAVKLPGDGGETVWLPIDAKFPGDTFAALQDAYESGSAETVKSATAILAQTLRNEARMIREKYIAPPYTTEFAIMFLPFEGLYAEAVNRGLIEKFQSEFRVSLAGPSTMAALLNSLQMGFRTLAIQKRSAEVWQVLGNVKAEFDKFAEVLEKSQTHLRQTQQDLDTLVGTRTNAILRRLRDVQVLEERKEES
ncbi:MAG: DNA recombination protein RmuC [Clostridiales bacterium]|nr:DNA recombination protein RmuC [Clostridiales bacterium]